MTEFKANTDKILEALVFVADRRPHLSFLQILKVLFIAENAHVKKYARPITGDRYVAMKNGPVGSSAYNMLKCDFLTLPARMEPAVNASFAVRRGSKPTVIALRKAELHQFSETEIEELVRACERVSRMSVSALWREVHSHPAYKSAVAKGGKNPPMDYGEFAPQDEREREEFLEELAENAAYAVI